MAGLKIQVLYNSCVITRKRDYWFVRSKTTEVLSKVHAGNMSGITLRALQFPKWWLVRIIMQLLTEYNCHISGLILHLPLKLMFPTLILYMKLK